VCSKRYPGTALMGLGSRHLAPPLDRGKHKRTQLQPTVATHLGADTTESGSYDALRTSTCDHDRAQVGHNPAPPLAATQGTEVVQLASACPLWRATRPTRMHARTRIAQHGRPKGAESRTTGVDFLGYKTGTVLHAGPRTRSCGQPARPFCSPDATAAPAVVCFSRGAHWLSLCLILMSAWRASKRRCASCSKPPPGPRRSAPGCRRPAARRGAPAAGARG
jgi:hypothetical protein